MSKRKPFADIPGTSEDAAAVASRLSRYARNGFEPRPGEPPFAVQAQRLRRLSAFLLEQEHAATKAADRRARVRMAQFETGGAEAW